MLKRFTIGLLTILMVISSGLNAHFDFMQPFKEANDFTYDFNQEIKEVGSLGDWAQKNLFEPKVAKKKELLAMIDNHIKRLNRVKWQLRFGIGFEHAIASSPVVLSIGSFFNKEIQWREAVGLTILSLPLSYALFYFIYTAGEAREDREEHAHVQSSLAHLKALRALVFKRV